MTRRQRQRVLKRLAGTLVPNKSKSSIEKRKLKKRLYKRAHGKCALCGRQLSFDKSTIDHIIPQSKGGSWDSCNLQLACFRCNGAKGSDSNLDKEIRI